jgi:hypothetical protein
VSHAPSIFCSSGDFHVLVKHPEFLNTEHLVEFENRDRYIEGKRQRQMVGEIV